MPGFVNSMKGYVSRGFTYNIHTDYDTFRSGMHVVSTPSLVLD